MTNETVEKAKAKFGHNADAEKKNVDGNSDTKDARDMVPFQQDLYDDVQADANAYTKDARNQIEPIFGVNAGIVWKALNHGLEVAFILQRDLHN